MKWSWSFQEATAWWIGYIYTLQTTGRGRLAVFAVDVAIPWFPKKCPYHVVQHQKLKGPQCWKGARDSVFLLGFAKNNVKNMKEPTLVINHSIAPSVTTSVQHKAIWRAMKEPTTVISPFRCPKCDYKCSTSSHLKRHERTHTGGKPIRGSQCGYQCKRLNILRKHERTHTGDKPFNCSQCDYMFNIKQFEEP